MYSDSKLPNGLTAPLLLRFLFVCLSAYLFTPIYLHTYLYYMRKYQLQTED